MHYGTVLIENDVWLKSFILHCCIIQMIMNNKEKIIRNRILLVIILLGCHTKHLGYELLQGPQNGLYL